ncbi:MAG: aspartate dehydrogenase [Chloroflexi bacterium]|nr:aspartate dehydrogenase [Chloroflexota bacterium]
MTASSPVGIGLLGCGAMGAELALAVGPASGPASGPAKGPEGIQNARMAALFDQDGGVAGALAAQLQGDVPTFADVSGLLSADGVDLVVECASQAAIKAHGRSILDAGKSLLLMSSGALLDPDTYRGMDEAARANGVEILVPSGAVGGIDALRAVRNLLDSVTIVSTKKPEALSGAPGFVDWEDRKIDGPTVIFEGNAIDAVGLFPANVNVAATISLAGLGPQRTIVKVVADPDSPGNVHEVDATGAFGEFSFRFVNRPHATNPKTSYLAVLAAIEALRSFCEPGPRIGT